MLDGLVAACGRDRVLTDPDLLRSYETDWTGVYAGKARAVVRPADADEVAAVVAWCAANRVPLVTQGGNTGLVGGSVPDPSGDAVVLTTAGLGSGSVASESVGSLASLGAVDRTSGQVTVGAGVSLAAVQAHVRPHGLDVGVDLAPRGSATIGGMVATNAGGIRVLRYGSMRRQVAGLEAVLGTGDVVSHLAGVDKDNTGFDLAGLLCGSEGVLGVITRVRLRLVPVVKDRTTALTAWDSLDDAVTGLRNLRGSVELYAAEYMVDRGVALVTEQFGIRSPFARSYPAYVLIETSAPVSSLGPAVDGLEAADVAVATTPSQRDQLWALRELHTQALARVGPPHKYDVSVPLASVPAFVAAVDAAVGAAVGAASGRAAAGGGLVCHHFGHLGDGNVHLNVLGPVPPHLDGAIYELVAVYGGSISAEHGIGRLKRPWLHLSRSPAELDAFRRIKAALDPAAILNPGVLLPDR